MIFILLLKLVKLKLLSGFPMLRIENDGLSLCIPTLHARMTEKKNPLSFEQGGLNTIFAM